MYHAGFLVADKRPQLLSSENNGEIMYFHEGQKIGFRGCVSRNITSNLIKVSVGQKTLPDSVVAQTRVSRAPSTPAMNCCRGNYVQLPGGFLDVCSFHSTEGNKSVHQLCLGHMPAAGL